MDRALREFRIRGVKTNIPFLENVVNHGTFQSGQTTTTFLDESRNCFALVVGAIAPLAAELPAM
jgi:pyruvate carboxylase